jgi:hypothetical protein
VNVILDAVGAARMDSRLVERMEGCGVSVVRFRPPRPYALRASTIAPTARCAWSTAASA